MTRAPGCAEPTGRLSEAQWPNNALLCGRLDGQCRCITAPPSVVHRSGLPPSSRLCPVRAHLLARVLVFALILVPGPARAQDAPAAPEADVITAPVEIDGEVLFRIRGVSSLPATERAQRIRERIVAVAKDPAVAPDSLHLVATEAGTYLQAGKQPIMTVVDADARLEQVNRAVLAQAHLLRIQQAI